MIINDSILMHCFQVSGFTIFYTLLIWLVSCYEDHERWLAVNDYDSLDWVILNDYWNVSVENGLIKCYAVRDLMCQT